MTSSDEQYAEVRSHDLKAEELKWQKQKFSIAMAVTIVVLSFVMMAFLVSYQGNDFRDEVHSELIIQQNEELNKILDNQVELHHRFQELERNQQRSEINFQKIQNSLDEIRVLIESNAIRDGN